MLRPMGKHQWWIWAFKNIFASIFLLFLVPWSDPKQDLKWLVRILIHKIFTTPDPTGCGFRVLGLCSIPCFWPYLCIVLKLELYGILLSVLVSYFVLGNVMRNAMIQQWAEMEFTKVNLMTVLRLLAAGYSRCGFFSDLKFSSTIYVSGLWVSFPH